MATTLVTLFLLLLILLVLLALAALLALGLMRRRRQDRTLRALEDYFVTVERIDGRTWSGVLELTPAGFEIRYPTAGEAEAPPAEASYIHYAVEYDDLQAIYRDVDALSPAEASRRQADLSAEHSHRSWRRRIGVALENALDALDESAGLFSEREQTPQAIEIERPAAAGGAGEHFLVGYTGNRFDPLLERSLGQRVVCQMFVRDTLFERTGTLQAYSQRFLFFIDMPYPSERVIYFGWGDTSRVESDVRLSQNGRRLEISNQSRYPLLLDSLRTGETTKDLGMLLDPNQSFHLVLDIGEDTKCELRCQVVRRLDIVAPRRRAVVRYRAGAEDERRLFDVGVSLALPAEPSQQEERLRWELRQHPRNAAAAASLGRLLYRKGDLAQAERYFLQALEQPHTLPDQGKRVTLELQQLRRRRGHALERRA